MPSPVPRAGRIFCNTHTRLQRARFLCGTALQQKAADAPDKAYAKSLLLPKTAFPLRADAVKREPLFRQRTCDDLYQWQVGLVQIRPLEETWPGLSQSPGQSSQSERPLFVFHDGPPYANGNLHMGSYPYRW
jgi:isoleucyl-tRNA synthetase